MRTLPPWRLAAGVCILLAALLPAGAPSKSHPITTFLNAKWHRTPVCLEIAEYLFDENPSLYWEYVERLHSLDTPLHTIAAGAGDAKLYRSALRAAEPLTGSAQLGMLKVALAMHTQSPRVQAHFQIAAEVIAHGDCGTTAFATIGSKVACTVDELRRGLAKASRAAAGNDGVAEATTTTRTTPSDESAEEEIYSFDHVYPGSENNSLVVVLYAELGTAEFQAFHETLKPSSAHGTVKYVARHYVRHLPADKVRLSGYGVELYLKSTEYKSQDDSPRNDDDAQQMGAAAEAALDGDVDGFDFRRLRERFPSLVHSLNRFQHSLSEQSDEIAPLKAWEFQELGMQAAQRVAEIQGEEALQILQLTAQNFPMQAKSLLSVRVADAFRAEMKHNVDVLGRQLNLQPPDAALFVNGLFFDVDTLDVGALLETLRTELRVLNGLHQLGVSGRRASALMALEMSKAGDKDFAVDVRDSSVVWVNDLETDAEYKRWPSSVMDLLRPTFPGMLRNVRRNLFNLVLLVDPVRPEARGIIKLVESFVVHSAPVRVGFVFDSRDVAADKVPAYRAVVCAFNYARHEKNVRSALSLLTDIFAAIGAKEDITVASVVKALRIKFRSLSDQQAEDIVGEDSDFHYGDVLAGEFLDRLGVAQPDRRPQVLLNGVPLPAGQLNADDFEEAILTEIMQQTPTIQKAVYKGELTDNDSAFDWLMELPHIMPRLNHRILSAAEPTFVDMSGRAHAELSNVKALLDLSVRDMTATLMANVRYFGSRHALERVNGRGVHFLTLWVVADLGEPAGRQLLTNALHYMKSSGGIRVAFVPNTESERPDEHRLNRLVWAASQSLEPVEATATVLRWLTAKDLAAAEVPESVTALLSSAELHIKMLRVYAQRVLGLRAAQRAVISNGRVIGPLNDDEIFAQDDFGLIERLVSLQFADKVRKVLQDGADDDEEDSSETGEDGDVAGTNDENGGNPPLDSDAIVRLAAILVPRQQTKSRFATPKELKMDHTAVRLPPKQAGQPYFDLLAVLDPASKGAQKLAPILVLLRNIINCDMRVLLAAVDKHSDMPVKNFYRFVIEPELQFNADGRQRSGPYARFVGLPANPILTQNLQVPENWMVEAVRSVYDLDNIRLADINGPVHSEFELEHLLLEGHCFDATSGSPPRGLQFTLGTRDRPVVVDTIVMANLGYFQLKANPGAWLLRLRHGKSDDIYEVTSADGPNTVHHSAEAGGTRVIISSLRSHVLKVRVTKRPGQAGADLLADEADEASNGGLWNSITSSFGGGGGGSGGANEDGSAAGGEAQSVETINIFSVASGHLYERLLRIMMLSLLKHTKTPVKFWFLKNYLSPQFIDVLPHMAHEYGFQYALVQYKWPRWLHQQSEKQRIIWGYKILFLDVLFPLDVKKIIFVDADAIVRADIKELNDLDLGGAPYAYTPFCDSRKDMEGFRFWKQGYWRNHLQHRKYHISALYVVDLRKFRRVAAGDRLRGQYQALSQDPNSLSNLDQDLPNNMIHQVAIKSLPQEWLWCQTWCSEDTFASAKTIDLCNNPQTKEAKLTAAQRIVPEWSGYDAEIKRLLARVEEREHQADGSEEPAPVTVPGEENDDGDDETEAIDSKTDGHTEL